MGVCAVLSYFRLSVFCFAHLLLSSSLVLVVAMLVSSPVQVCGLAGGKYVLPCVAADWAPGAVLSALSALVLRERLENLEQEHFDVLRYVRAFRFCLLVH